MTHTHAKIKVKGQFVQQTVVTNGRTDTTDRTAFSANSVGNTTSTTRGENSLSGHDVLGRHKFTRHTGYSDRMSNLIKAGTKIRTTQGHRCTSFHKTSQRLHLKQATRRHYTRRKHGTRNSYSGFWWVSGPITTRSVTTKLKYVFYFIYDLLICAHWSHH